MIGQSRGNGCSHACESSTQDDMVMTTFMYTYTENHRGGRMRGAKIARGK